VREWKKVGFYGMALFLMRGCLGLEKRGGEMNEREERGREGKRMKERREGKRGKGKVREKRR